VVFVAGLCKLVYGEIFMMMAFQRLKHVELLSFIAIL
jgi:hypothetical protein